MAKKIIRAALFAALLALSFIIYKQWTNQDETIRCQADAMDTDILHEKDEISYEVRLNYIFNAQKESMVNMTGYITFNNERYRILRTAYFTLELSDNKDIYNIKYTRENIFPNDNTPKKISQLLMSSQFDGDNGHIRLTRIKDNTYIIHGISQPIALCYRY
ncbi:FidL-like protein [Serratia liquefaciens]|uniref:FidL-like protein n=1 Tax=Serratia liquefaciens TaxID=614 RepID=UPI00235F5EB3|nr:FidL-like protein [Serratia liquefaciens]